MGFRAPFNLSALQFQSGDLVALVRETLEETGLPADRLEFEITESVLIEEKDEVLRRLSELRAMGVHITTWSASRCRPPPSPC